MPPIVHLVRHAEGYHNLTAANYKLKDPILTPRGKQQCRNLARWFPYHSSVSLLVSSPLRRTLQTTLISFSPEISKGLQIVALPEAQETSSVACDTGSDLSTLEDEFGDLPVDLSLVPEGWNSKKGKWATSTPALKARAKELRQWLKARPEKEIVLVTHGGFLHYITEDWADQDKYAGTGWCNTEFRSYSFQNDDKATMIETKQSQDLRRRKSLSIARSEQAEFGSIISHTASKTGARIAVKA